MHRRTLEHMCARNALLAVCMGLLLFPAFGNAHAASRNVLLSRGRTEPVLASNRNHPTVIIAGANTNYGAPVGDTFPTAYFTSRDSGSSFTSNVVPMVRPYTTGADPSVSIANSGTVFYAFLGETPSYCSGGRSAILLTRSFDGGRSFNVPVVVDANSADDKPFMTVQNVQGHPAVVIITWTRWHNRGSDIWASRSTNGGSEFSRPLKLYSSRLNNFGPVPVAAGAGRLAVFWSTFVETSLTAAAPTQILERLSSDNARSFGKVRLVTTRYSSVPRMAQPGSLRNLPAPAATADDQGHLYVSWSAVYRDHGQGVVDSRIYLRRSSDFGLHWSAPVRVDDAPTGDRFMPAISSLDNNSVGVAFYDRRGSRWSMNLFAARVSFDAGGVAHRFPNVRISTSASSINDIFYIAPGSTCFSPGRFFGDYIGAASSRPGRLDVAWADTQLHVYHETEVWYASLQLIDASPKKTRIRLAVAPDRLLHSLGFD